MRILCARPRREEYSGLECALEVRSVGAAFSSMLSLVKSRICM